MPAQLAYLAFDLGLHIERRLASSLPAVVTRNHELPNLLAQSRIDRGRGQALKLAFVVHGRLSPPAPKFIARCEELPDLLLALAAVAIGPAALGSISRSSRR